MQNNRGLSRRLKTFIYHNLRLIGTGFSFVVFGLGALDLAFILLPIIIIISPKDKLRRVRIQKTISWNFRLFLALIQHLKLMTLKIDGIEYLQADRGVLVIANHPTLIDIVVLIAFLPEIDCVVKESLKQNYFLHRIIKISGYIMNSDPKKMLIECKERLNQGRNLIIFPEGTRTNPGCKPHFKRGCARIAIQSMCQIRTIHISCSPSTLTKSQRWYEIPKRPFIFKVHVGELINIESWYENSLLHGVLSRRLTQYLELNYYQTIA